MTKTLRIGDAVFSDLVTADGSGPYPAGTALAVVSYDDGDRFITRVSDFVADALAYAKD